MSDYTYELRDSVYLNITNRCNNSCTFCIKFKNRQFENTYNLWLDREPAVSEIIESIKSPENYKHIVFCGYGEPLIRLRAVKEIAKHFHEKGSHIRIDTDGQANLFHERDIIPELSSIIDEMNVSLNAHDSDTYIKLCRPLFKDKAYPALIEFAKKAKECIAQVTLSLVDLHSVDKDKCSAIAKELGLPLIVRPYYEKIYVI